MPRYLSINVKCTECEAVWGELATTEELEQDLWECPNCKAKEGHRTVNSVTPLRSTVRMKKSDYEDMKAINKVKKQMYDTPPDQRKEAQKEIAERQKIK